jgi:multidrug efflux pump subunit AcrA (membrane-fusion protein)
MTERTGRPWLNYLLGLLCVGAVVAAILVVGPASGSQTATTRTAKAARGVVQSTVSGSGNLQPASQLNLGFKTSGTVTNIYVTQGVYVTQGRLLATLDPQSAEVTLEQAKAALQSAEANLAKEEETDGEGSTSSGNSGAGGGASAAAASVHRIAASTIATDANSPTGASRADSPASASPATAPPSAMSTPTTATTPDSASPRAASPGATTPVSTVPTTTSTPGTTSTPDTRTTTTSSSQPTRTTSTSKTTSPGSQRRESESAGSSSGGGEGSSSSAAKPTISAATREANLASARAAVKSDQLTVRSDEQAVQDTKLYAPEDGTIVSLSGQVGEVVSANGTTKASSDNSSSGSSGSGASAAGTSALGRSAAGASSASSSSSSTGSSSSSFAVLSDLSSMQLVVALSESEIGNVKAGQIATVTVEALSGLKLAAHVSEVATLSTSSSGVVSYDVTFQLDQMEPGLKPGMSATAEVVVKQAEGVNVPTSAISASSVTVVRGGKDVRQRVVTGLAGDSSTIVLSGVKAGETVVLPAATSTSSSTSLTSRLGSRLGGGGLAGGGLAGGGGGFAGGGGAAFFRGGG